MRNLNNEQQAITCMNNQTVQGYYKIAPSDNPIPCYINIILGRRCVVTTLDNKVIYLPVACLVNINNQCVVCSDAGAYTYEYENESQHVKYLAEAIKTAYAGFKYDFLYMD